MTRRGQRGASRHRAGQDKAERGNSGTARGAVGLTQPDDAGADQAAKLAADSGGVNCQRKAGQAERSDDGPGGGQIRCNR
jgi:hypothetical protein